MPGRERYGLECAAGIEIALVRSWLLPEATLARWVEKRVHLELAVTRVRGEWFPVTPEVAVETVSGWVRRRPRGRYRRRRSMA